MWLEGVNCIHQVFVNVIMNLWVPQNQNNLLSSQAYYQLPQLVTEMAKYLTVFNS